MRILPWQRTLAARAVALHEGQPVKLKNERLYAHPRRDLEAPDDLYIANDEHGRFEYSVRARPNRERTSGPKPEHLNLLQAAIGFGSIAPYSGALRALVGLGEMVAAFRLSSPGLALSGVKNLFTGAAGFLLDAAGLYVVRAPLQLAAAGYSVVQAWRDRGRRVEPAEILEVSKKERTAAR